MIHNRSNHSKKYDNLWLILCHTFKSFKIDFKERLHGITDEAITNQNL